MKKPFGRSPRNGSRTATSAEATPREKQEISISFAWMGIKRFQIRPRDFNPKESMDLRWLSIPLATHGATMPGSVPYSATS